MGNAGTVEAGGTAEEQGRARLRDRVVELASNIHAVESELAGLIAEPSDTEAWHGPGYVSLRALVGGQRRVHAVGGCSDGSVSQHVRAELRALTAAADGLGRTRPV